MQMKNVLLFIMDDQRADTIGYLGNNEIHTPVLDNLAREGSFLRPYTTCPVCTPGRAELLSGKNAFQNGCRWFGEPIHSEIKTLPMILSDAGYHTAIFGKWHNDGHPAERGFQTTGFIFPYDLTRPIYDHNFTYEVDGKPITGHSTELICGGAAKFIENRNEDKPWFCYVSLHSPHDPRHAPEPFASMYYDKMPSLPENYMPEHPFDNGDMLIRDERLASFPRRHNEIRRHRADYYAMITHHDYHIGKVLDALDETGQTDNTLIIFTSDHGLAIGSHGLMGKENLYEHSARVPLIWKGEGIPKSKRFDNSCICGHYDFLPTICDYLGLPKQSEGISGISYYEVLKGTKKTVRNSITAAYRDCMRMATDGRYKLIYYPHIERYQLFDLLEDPQELNDLNLEYRRYPEGRACPPPLCREQKEYTIDEGVYKLAPRFDDTPQTPHPLLNPVYIPAIDAADADEIIKKLKSALLEWQVENNDTSCTL